MSTAQAYQTILGAAAVICALIAQSMVARRFATRKHGETVAKLDDVHDLVDGAATLQVQRIDQLEQVIEHSNATLPAIPQQEDT